MIKFKFEKDILTIVWKEKLKNFKVEDKDDESWTTAIVARMKITGWILEMF